MMRRLLVLLVFLPLVSACYGYTDIGIANVAPQQMVRVDLTPDGVQRLETLLAAEPWYGAGSLFRNEPVPLLTDATRMEGRVVTASPDELRLSVEHPNASDREFAFRVVDLAGIKRKEVDEVKTWLMVGAILGGSVLALSRVHLIGHPAPGVEIPTGDGGPLTVYGGHLLR